MEYYKNFQKNGNFITLKQFIINEKSPIIFRHLPCFRFLSLVTSVIFSSFKLNKIVMFESFLVKNSNFF